MTLIRLCIAKKDETLELAAQRPACFTAAARLMNGSEPP